MAAQRGKGSSGSDLAAEARRRYCDERWQHAPGGDRQIVDGLGRAVLGFDFFYFFSINGADIKPPLQISH